MVRGRKGPGYLERKFQGTNVPVPGNEYTSIRYVTSRALLSLLICVTVLLSRTEVNIVTDVLWEPKYIAYFCVNKHLARQLVLAFKNRVRVRVSSRVRIRA